MTEYRNIVTDTPSHIDSIVAALKRGIMTNTILGAFSWWSEGIPILFSHAGLRPLMFEKIIAQNYGEDFNKNRNERIKDNEVQQTADYINEVLRNSISSSCQSESYNTNESLETIKGKKKYSNPHSPCDFRHDLFSAGRERGGQGVGGSYWTDFSVHVKESNRRKMLSSTSSLASSTTENIVQVVGHSIAVNKIRMTSTMSAVCVDAGMYLGGRAFVEIVNGRFYSIIKSTTPSSLKSTGGQWNRVDLSAKFCEDGVAVGDGNGNS